MFYVRSSCEVCNNGLLAVRRCADGTLIVLCYECEATWLDPRDVRGEASLRPDPETWKLAEVDLEAGTAAGADWATREEIVRGGWEGYIQGEWTPPRHRPAV